MANIGWLEETLRDAVNVGYGGCTHDEIDAALAQGDMKDAEIERLKQDLACRDGGLGLIYSIREALGFNQYYSLSNLDDNARQQRAALLACAPFAFATFEHEKVRNGFIGMTYPDNDQPIEVTIRTTLGAIREARRALWVADVQPPTKATVAKSDTRCANPDQCTQPFNWDDGVPYCDTCGMFRSAVAQEARAAR